MKRPSAQPIVLHAVLAALAALTIFPLLWMLAASFMAPGGANTLPPRLWPESPTFEHYAALFERMNLARSLSNSAIVAVASTLLSLLVNSLAGYAFAKLRFHGRDRTFALLLGALVIPAQVGMLPLFLLLERLGLVNSLWSAIIPSIATVFGIFMVRQFALSVPDALLDAARIDGAGEFEIYRTIVLPLLKPILVTLAAFTFLSAWNDFMWPLIVLSDESKYTLPVALANLSGEHVQDTELMMAGAVITVLPTILVFLWLQRAYVRGVMMGGVKG